MNTISLHPSIKQVVDNGSGVLISPLGGFDVTNVVTPAQKTFDLQTLYRAIGCDYIEIVDVPETEYILVCDEEGLLKNNATLNYEATELAGRPIVGNVVLCHTSSIPQKDLLFVGSDPYGINIIKIKRGFYNSMDSVIVDLDGTLADCNHRLHFIESNKKDWQSFFNNCGEDLVIEPVRELINMLKEKYMIIILTARPESIREPTTKWLEDNNIDYDALFMRSKNDYRKSPIVKSNLIEEMKCHDYIPVYAIEDRDDCIDMFNSLGIFTLKVYNSVPV